MAGGGGGAWKVAYADFVTAMMAFFMVMWLVSQDQKVKGFGRQILRRSGRLSAFQAPTTGLKIPQACSNRNTLVRCQVQRTERPGEVEAIWRVERIRTARPRWSPMRFLKNRIKPNAGRAKQKNNSMPQRTHRR
jgi:flagellar motor protein MotB